MKFSYVNVLIFDSTGYFVERYNIYCIRVSWCTKCDYNMQVRDWIKIPWKGKSMFPYPSYARPVELRFYQRYCVVPRHLQRSFDLSLFLFLYILKKNKILYLFDLLLSTPALNRNSFEYLDIRSDRNWTYFIFQSRKSRATLSINRLSYLQVPENFQERLEF